MYLGGCSSVEVEVGVVASMLIWMTLLQRGAARGVWWRDLGGGSPEWTQEWVEETMQAGTIRYVRSLAGRFLRYGYTLCLGDEPL